MWVHGQRRTFPWQWYWLCCASSWFRFKELPEGRARKRALPEQQQQQNHSHTPTHSGHGKRKHTHIHTHTSETLNSTRPERGRLLCDLHSHRKRLPAPAMMSAAEGRCFHGSRGNHDQPGKWNWGFTVEGGETRISAHPQLSCNIRAHYARSLSPAHTLTAGAPRAGRFLSAKAL